MSFSLCSTVGANTGVIKCDVVRGRPLGLIFGSAVFAASSYINSATFEAAFKLKINQATGVGDKLFPIPEIQGNTDNTDAPKQGSLGYGLKFTLLEGKPAYTFDIVVGSSLEKRLRKFHNKTLPLFVFDDAENIWGVSDVNGNFKGADVQVSVIGKGFDDGANVKTTKISVAFLSAGDFYDNAAFVSTDFNISDFPGLVDGNLSEYAAHVANLYKMAIKISTTQLGNYLSVFDYYDDELAVASMWQAFTGAAFTTPLAITSVAKNVTNKGWDVTLDATAFNALSAGAKIKIAVVDPATLAAAGVTELEVASVIVTK